MKSTVQLDNKEIKTIIAKFLGIPEDQVIPMRYNFSVEGMSVEEIQAKINK